LGSLGESWPGRRGLAGVEAARQGPVWISKARQPRPAWLGKAGGACDDSAGLDKARLGRQGQPGLWVGSSRLGVTEQGKAGTEGLGRARHDRAGGGRAGQDMAGAAWLGLVWPVMSRLGLGRTGQARQAGLGWV
jgi:hypothetical protein